MATEVLYHDAAGGRDVDDADDANASDVCGDADVDDGVVR